MRLRKGIDALRGKLQLVCLLAYILCVYAVVYSPDLPPSPLETHTTRKITLSLPNTSPHRYRRHPGYPPGDPLIFILKIFTIYTLDGKTTAGAAAAGAASSDGGSKNTPKQIQWRVVAAAAAERAEEISPSCKEE